jgi:DNA polymerase I-like protein with 3'-5' exonuclease and polymerase domains
MKIILDIETNSTHDKIWLVVTRNIETGEVKQWTEASGLQKYLDQCDLIIMHNGISFDAPVLRKNWKVTMKLSQVYDTLVASRLLSPSKEGGHSLEAWGQRLGFPKGDFSDWDSGLSEDMITYCIQDTLVTQKLYEYLLTEFKNDKFDDRSIDLEHKVQAIICKQEQNGFKLDQQNAIILLAELKGKLSNLEDALQSVFPTKTTERYSEKTGKKLKDDVEVFNPGSRQQIASRLQEKGWKPKRFTDKGQAIVDETTLNESTIPEAKLIGEYLLLQKRISQIDSWLKVVGKDGRVHGRIITNGAVTGRMTHMSPNMAQVPNSGSAYGEECRALWTVEKGYKLVGIDASGLELRMLAHYMNDDAYTTEVVSGDIHTANQKAAGLETRNQAKTFIYAFLYGAGSSKIGKIVGGSAKEGEKLITSFLSNTPKLQALRKTVSEAFSKKGSLPSLDGRRLQVRSEHSALNTLLQGAGAVVMKQALVLLDKKLKSAKIDYKFVANVHDEWQIEVEEGRADEVGKMGVKAIEEAGSYLGKLDKITKKPLGMNCPLTGEYKVGNNWKETH